MNTDELVELCFSRPHAWSLDHQLETTLTSGTREPETLAHVETGVRTILADGAAVRMGQIAWVCCDPDWRSRGLTSTLIRAAHTLMRDQADVEFFGLFADIPGYYERLGYRQAPNLGEWGMVAEVGRFKWNYAWSVDLQGGEW